MSQTLTCPVSATESLLRDHNFLGDVFLIYTSLLRFLQAGREFPAEALTEIARFVSDYFEQYHEKLEEEYVFSRLEDKENYKDIVKILYEQHIVSRKVTREIIRISGEDFFSDDAMKKQLAGYIQMFVAMYSAHASRESDVIFPTIRKIYPEEEYARVGEAFRERAERLFGKDSFEATVNRLAGIEKSLGLYDLSQYTPRI